MTNFLRSVEPAHAQVVREFKGESTQVYVFVIHNAELTKSPSQHLAKRYKWKDKEYRHAYMEASIEQGVAWQIRVNRERRGMSQKDLAKKIKSRQSAISRAENTEYGKHSLETLTKIANAFDCALQVRFVSYSKLAMDNEDLSQAALYAKPYEKELEDAHQESSPQRTIERSNPLWIIHSEP